MLSAFIAGCGGSQLPIGTQGPESQPVSEQGSTLASESSRSSGDLLYVADGVGGAVYFYSYPQGVKLGRLTGTSMPQALCADHVGDVFVTNAASSGNASIVEYARGGTTPIRILSDPGVRPLGCAVSPVTGDLAVANSCSYIQSGCGGRGNVVIYPSAKGSPKPYSTGPVSFVSYCGYDAAGELDVDGTTRRNPIVLLGLPKGGDALKLILVHWQYQDDIQQPGGVQWDGEFLAVGSAQGENITPAVYRVSTSNWQVKSALTLHKSQSVLQYFIDGNVLIAPNRPLHGGGEVLFYSYPEGVKLTKRIGGQACRSLSS
jgi:hypothetical protein